MRSQGQVCNVVQRSEILQMYNERRQFVHLHAELEGTPPEESPLILHDAGNVACMHHLFVFVYLAGQHVGSLQSIPSRAGVRALVNKCRRI